MLKRFAKFSPHLKFVLAVENQLFHFKKSKKSQLSLVWSTFLVVKQAFSCYMFLFYNKSTIYLT